MVIPAMAPSPRPAGRDGDGAVVVIGNDDCVGVNIGEQGVGPRWRRNNGGIIRIERYFNSKVIIVCIHVG